MDTLSNFYGWLTGKWTKQSTLGKAMLGCVVLPIMACACGIPLLVIYLIEL